MRDIIKLYLCHIDMSYIEYRMNTEKIFIYAASIIIFFNSTV